MIGNTADTDHRSDNMPEFYLDHGTPEATATYNGLDAFTQGYVEAMFFTETGDDLADATFADLAPETLARIVQDCERFQTDNAALLEQVYGVTGKYEKNPYDAERAGNDYWYTRNGHGAGFWDRGLGDVGDKLASAARYSGVTLYRGDDGLLYL